MEVMSFACSDGNLSRKMVSGSVERKVEACM